MTLQDLLDFRDEIGQTQAVFRLGRLHWRNLQAEMMQRFWLCYVVTDAPLRHDVEVRDCNGPIARPDFSLEPAAFELDRYAESDAR